MVTPSRMLLSLINGYFKLGKIVTRNSTASFLEYLKTLEGHLLVLNLKSPLSNSVTVSEFVQKAVSFGRIDLDFHVMRSSPNNLFIKGFPILIS